MRVLIYGLIGAAVSAGAWFAIEHSTHRDLGWLAVVVGLVTGWAVHKGAAVGAGGGYVRGALAVVLSLAAIVGGRQVYAKWMQSTSDDAAGVAKVAVVELDEAEEEPADTGDAPADTTVLEEAEVADRPAGRLGDQKMPLKQRMTEMDMVWMCVAALCAYVVGKGPDPTPATEQAEQPVPEPEPEPEGSEQQV